MKKINNEIEKFITTCDLTNIKNHSNSTNELENLSNKMKYQIEYIDQSKKEEYSKYRSNIESMVVKLGLSLVSLVFLKEIILLPGVGIMSYLGLSMTLAFILSLGMGISDIIKVRDNKRQIRKMNNIRENSKKILNKINEEIKLDNDKKNYENYNDNYMESRILDDFFEKDQIFITNPYNKSTISKPKIKTLTK